MRHHSIIRYTNLALLAIIISLTGCGPSAPTTSRPVLVHREETVALPTNPPPPEPSPSNTRVLSSEAFTPEPSPTPTPIPDEVRALVVDVIDGDTIIAVMEGDPTSLAYVVRYLGIDAPPNTPNDPWGVVAYEANRKMTNLKVVHLVRDQTNFDDEDRLLRYVYLDNQLMSIILAEQGLARANIVEPDIRFQAEIEEAEARARQGRLGLWGTLPTPTSPRVQPTTEEEGTPESETTPPGTATAEPEGTAETPTSSSPATEESSPEPEATSEPTTEGG